MTPHEIKQVREDLGRTYEGMAKILGVSISTILRWENGESVPIPMFRKKLMKLQAYTRGRK